MSAPRELNRRQSARGRGERRTRTKLQPRARTTVSAFSESISAVSQGPVLVIVPCLNEEDYIENVVTRLVAEADRIDLKVVVADGGSIDRNSLDRSPALELEPAHRIVGQSQAYSGCRGKFCSARIWRGSQVSDPSRCAL